MHACMCVVYICVCVRVLVCLCVYIRLWLCVCVRISGIADLPLTSGTSSKSWVEESVLLIQAWEAWPGEGR